MRKPCPTGDAVGVFSFCSVCLIRLNPPSGVCGVKSCGRDEERGLPPQLCEEAHAVRNRGPLCLIVDSCCDLQRKQPRAVNVILHVCLILILCYECLSALMFECLSSLFWVGFSTLKGAKSLYLYLRDNSGIQIRFQPLCRKA